MSLHRLIITASLLFLTSFHVLGQVSKTEDIPLSHDDALRTLLDAYFDDEDEEELELLYEHLSEIAANPININAVKYASGKDGNGKNGFGKNGFGKNGLGKNGFGKNGSGKDRVGKNGSGKGGTGREMENPLEEQLAALMFLSAEQIDDIVEYVVRYGPMRTKSELMMIPSLDVNRRRLLSSLIVLGESDREKRSKEYHDALLALPAVMGDSALMGDSAVMGDSSLMDELGMKGDLKSAMARDGHTVIGEGYARGELTAFARIPFYEDRDADKYNGGKIKHWLRADYRFSQRLKLGFLASQDAGEPFFAGRNKTGYDLYSAYLQMKNIRLGSDVKMKNLVVGRFRIRSATGLIINSGNSFRSFGISSVSSLPSLPSSQVSITPGISRSEATTLQGIATTVAFGSRWEGTLFASFRHIDATTSIDADGMESVSTILRTGYHRTDSELARKHNLSETSLGMIMGFHSGRASLGISAVYDHYSLPLLPYEEGASLSKLYKRFYPAGKDFFNMSINYGYRLGKRIIFNGETAISLHSTATSLATSPHSTATSLATSLHSTATSLHQSTPMVSSASGLLPATVNTLSYRASKVLTLSLLERFYPYRFWATLGRSFSAGGSNQNESGVYLAASWTPSANLSLTGYADMAYFAWPKYQALGSSHSFDNQLQLCWKVDSRQTVNMRYRLRMRERDADSKAAGYTPGDLIYKNEHRFRASYEWSERGSRPSMVLLSKMDMSYCGYKKRDFGVMVSQDATFRLRDVCLTFSAGYFNTSDYNARIYSYEHSTPYSLSFPAFDGEGVRVYGLADAVVLRRGRSLLSVIGKVEMTQYFSTRDNAQNQPALSICLRWRM